MVAAITDPRPHDENAAGRGRRLELGDPGLIELGRLEDALRAGDEPLARSEVVAFEPITLPSAEKTATSRT